MTPKQFDSVQKLLDATNPWLAEAFRRYQRRPLVRLRNWWELRKHRRTRAKFDKAAERYPED